MYACGTQKEGTHFHPMQLRVVVGFRKAGKHEVVRVLEERPSTESGGGEHGGVQGTRRVARVGMRVRRLRRLLMLRRGRRRRRGRQVLIDDAQLHDGRRVDGSTIGWGLRSANPGDPNGWRWKKRKKKKTYNIKRETKRRRRKKKKTHRWTGIPPTPHILACLGCCLTKRSYSRDPSIMVWQGGRTRGIDFGELQRERKRT